MPFLRRSNQQKCFLHYTEDWHTIIWQNNLYVEEIIDALSLGKLRDRIFHILPL